VRRFDRIGRLCRPWCLLLALLLAAASGAPAAAQSNEPEVLKPGEPAEKPGPAAPRGRAGDAPAPTGRPDLLEKPGAPEASPGTPPGSDPRSTELLQLDCANDLGRREITLFGNGTVRLREGPPGGLRLGLAELDPEALAGAIRRLGEENLSEVRRLEDGVAGPWVERCELALALPGRPARTLHYGRYDSLPLAVSRIVRVAEDLALEIELMEGAERLPDRYEPRRGDRLKRVDGVVFRITGFSADGRGLELQGEMQPLAVYILRDDLRKEFVALLPPRRAR
jgi:hypothetical protein